MKIIFARSPYHFIIDEVGQTETKLELFLWKSNAIQPVAPTYIFSELVPSISQSAASYNIANQSRDFLDNIAPDYTSVNESPTMWAYGRVKGYAKIGAFGTMAPTGLDETFIIVYGYTDYMNGANFSIDTPVFPMTSDVSIQDASTFFYIQGKQTIKMRPTEERLPYVNVMIQRQTGHTYWVEYVGQNIPAVSIQIPVTTNQQMCKIFLNNYQTLYEYTAPYTVRLLDIQGSSQEELWTRVIEPDCNTKYKPLLCSFINKYGGWENIWFTRANEVSITTKKTEYNLSPQSVFYDQRKGQKQNFNTNGTKSIKCNTGFVDELLFSELISQLMLSDYVTLENIPVDVKTSSSVMKTHLKDKNINYEIEFEYPFQMINNIS